MDPLASQFLKKCSGLARPANTTLLHLPGKDGGLNLPLLPSLHKRLQVSRQSQLLTSRDPCVRHMAEKAHTAEGPVPLQKKFRASKEVREVMSLDPDLFGKRLAKVAKQLVREQVDNQKLSTLQQLEKQGHMSRCSPSDGANVWAKALDAVPDEHLKCALNSTVDTLPHNANLHLWRKRACPLCGEKQTLIHIFNTCRVALRSGGSILVTTPFYHSLSTCFQPTHHQQRNSALTWVLMPSPSTL